ncbi:hypothetical protein C2W62_04450 [Candidatus Entotheonella serta]|nr:hypothetical protein C2W62_04450 [Candidatus Entotheonella serta]
MVDQKPDQEFLKALQQGGGKIAYTWLQQGANPHAQLADKTTALMLAAEIGHLPLVKALLAQQVDVNAIGPGRETALTWACSAGKSKVVRLLLAHGASVSVPRQRDTVFTWTIWSKRSERAKVDILEAVIAHEADVNRKDRAGDPPLRRCLKRVG